MAKESFFDIAEVLGCPKTIDAVRQTLSNLPPANRWLLILDNADDPTRDYQTYLPSGNRGSIMITSRNPQCGHLAKSGGHEELDNLEEPECIQLLRRTARLCEVSHDTEEYGLSMSLVRQLGHHTLAILHAASYIATTHGSISDYLDFLRTNRQRLLEKPRSQGKSRYDTVYATFGASIEFLEQVESGSLEETRKDSLQLLQILSIFHYMSVPLDILVDAWQGAKEALASPSKWEQYSHVLTAWHVAQLPDFVKAEGENEVKFRITEAVARLESLALVRTDTSARAGKSVSMHPLVHNWASDRQGEEEKKHSLRMTECVVALSQFAFQDWRPYYHQFATHLKLMVESDAELVDNAARSRHILQACVQIAWACHWVGLDRDMYEFTESIFQRLDLGDQEPTDELRELYRVCAIAVDREGSHSTQALKVFEAIERLDEKTRGENDLGRLKNLRDLGSAYLRNSKTSQAVVLLEKVVITYETLGQEHKDLLAAQNDLAVALTQDGQREQTILLLEKVVQLGERLLPADNPNRIISLRELAVAYLRDQQIEEATSRLEEVARLQVGTHGEEHSETATTQNLLASAYKRAGRVPEATALYERVVNTRTLVLGRDHPDVLMSQNCLARLYLDAGRIQDTIGIFEKIGNLDVSTTDSTDRMKLIPKDVLPEEYAETEKISEAISILEIAGDIRKARLEEKDPEGMGIRRVFVRGALEAGMISHALLILEQVVEVKGLMYEFSSNPVLDRRFGPARSLGARISSV